MKHEFSIYVKNISKMCDEMLDKLYEAGCSDATVSLSKGELTLDFAREANSRDDAIDSAIYDVRNANIGAINIKLSESIL